MNRNSRHQRADAHLRFITANIKSSSVRAVIKTICLWKLRTKQFENQKFRNLPTFFSTKKSVSLRILYQVLSEPWRDCSPLNNRYRRTISYVGYPAFFWDFEIQFEFLSPTEPWAMLKPVFRIRVFWKIGIRIRSENPNPRWFWISYFVRIYISVRAKPASVAKKCFLQGRIKLGRHFFLPMNRHMTIAYSNEIDK